MHEMDPATPLRLGMPNKGHGFTGYGKLNAEAGEVGTGFSRTYEKQMR
jgi:hypothetical protein